MKHILNFDFDENNKNCIKKTFDVSQKLDSLSIDIEIKSELNCTSYVILIDETGVLRFHKLLGFGGKTFVIGDKSDNTSIGGYPGEITIGRWTLIVYALLTHCKLQLDTEYYALEVIISDEKKEITNSIGSDSWVDYKNEQGFLTLSKFDWDRAYSSEPRWYKGDFHTHTQLSDGKEPVSNAMAKAKMMNLDFYAPTEHNLTHTGWVDTDIAIIPSVEVTTSKGHFNLFGLKSIPSEFVKELAASDTYDFSQDLINQILERSHEKGYINSINHPFLHIWKWELLDAPLKYIHAIEIINDPTYMYAPYSNSTAIRLLDKLWDDGFHIYGIGGSDSHNLIDERYENAAEPSVPGDPSTYVFCDNLTPANILNSVKNGHICVTRGIGVTPIIKVDGVKYLPGDEIKNPDNKRKLTVIYQLKIENSTENLEVYIIVNGEKKVMHSVIGYTESDITFEYTINTNSYTWIRAEIRTASDKFKGYVNPIYFGNKETSYTTYNDVLKEM